MSDTNRTTLLYFRETTWGRTPDSTDVLTQIPFTGESLQFNKKTAERTSIRSDRQPFASVKVGESASGTTNHELTALDHTEFLKGVMGNTSPVATDINAEACTISAAGNTITADAGTPFATLATQNANYIRVANAANAGNNGVKRIVSVTSTVITVGSGELTVDEAGVALDLNTNLIDNGTTKVSYLLERDHEDLSKNFWFNGMMINSATFTITAEAIITVSYDFLGKTGAVGVGGEGTSAGDGSPTADNGTEAITASGDVGAILLSATETSGCVQSASIVISNNLRERPCVSQVYGQQPGQGSFTVTGSLNLYFDDTTEYNQFLNHTAVKLQFPITDTDGNFIGLTIHSANFNTTPGPQVSGQNADTFVNLEFSAHKGAAGNLKVASFDILDA